MSRTSDFLIGALESAGWPLEGMELAIEIGEQVGYQRLEAELRDRAERACSGFTGCLVAFGDHRGVLCNPCPLTDLRDANSDECEYGPADEGSR